MNDTGRAAPDTRVPALARAAWGFSRLPHRGRIALLVLLCVVVVVDVILYIAEPSQTWREMAVGLAATIATALFAWWPPAAVISLFVLALAETTSAQSGPQMLYLVVVAGLVAYTCPTWFFGVYAGCTLALAVFTATVAETLPISALPVLALLLIVSAVVGWALRTAHRRVRRFAQSIEDLERARTVAIEAERERIADELHDIIAHDVTLVSMHARVLERVDDPALRERSLHAIRTSADQALADIRRMLRIVRDERMTASSRGDDHASAASALDETRASLERLGATVTVRTRIGVEMSAAIEKTLVHVLREGATNIAKHGTDHPEVSIVVESVDDGIRLTLANTTGPACAPYVPSSGYGLDRLRERVTLLDGRLDTSSRNGVWTLSVSLPAL